YEPLATRRVVRHRGVAVAQPCVGVTRCDWRHAGVPERIHMKIELWPLSKIKPYPGNPRVNDDAVDAVVASLKEFGFRQPIVVDADGVVIVGHTRLKAAQKLGLKQVPVHVATDLSPEKVRAYRIADHQTASIPEGDYELLPI